MAETSWDEVGKRFTDLGRELQKTWQASATSSEAKAHLNDAGEKVRTALDDVAQTINRAAASSEVRDAAKDAGNGVAEALSATLVQVVEWIEQAPKTWPPGGARQPDPDVDDVQDATEPADIQDAVIDGEPAAAPKKAPKKGATKAAAKSSKKAASKSAGTKAAARKKASD